MVRRISALILGILTAALLCLPAFAADFGSGDQRVFDYCGLLTPNQALLLEREIAEAREETGMDIVVLTADEAEYSYDDYEAERLSLEFADDFYDFNGFGAGEDASGIIYFIDMSNRMPTISTAGRAIDILTDRRLEDMLDNAWYCLVDGEYLDSALSVVQDFVDYCEDGVPEGAFQYDADTGEIISSPHKRLTGSELLAGIAAGAGVAAVTAAAVTAKYKVKGPTYSYDLMRNSSVKLTGKTDRYITTQRTVTRKPRNKTRSGGGGGRRSSGGSRVRTSSRSGRSHGGRSGRRF